MKKPRKTMTGLTIILIAYIISGYSTAETSLCPVEIDSESYTNLVLDYKVKVDDITDNRVDLDISYPDGSVDSVKVNIGDTTRLGTTDYKLVIHSATSSGGIKNAEICVTRNPILSLNPGFNVMGKDEGGCPNRIQYGVKNLGGYTAENVEGTLAGDEDRVCMIRTKATYGDLQPGEEEYNPASYLMKFCSNRNTEFDQTITWKFNSQEYSMQESIKIDPSCTTTCGQAEFKIHEVQITEKDAAMHPKKLRIIIENTGPEITFNTIGTLESITNGVTIAQPNAEYERTNPGDIKEPDQDNEIIVNTDLPQIELRLTMKYTECPEKDSETHKQTLQTTIPNTKKPNLKINSRSIRIQSTSS